MSSDSLYIHLMYGIVCLSKILCHISNYIKTIVLTEAWIKWIKLPNLISLLNRWCVFESHKKEKLFSKKKKSSIISKANQFNLAPVIQKMCHVFVFKWEISFSSFINECNVFGVCNSKNNAKYSYYYAQGSGADVCFIFTLPHAIRGLFFCIVVNEFTHPTTILFYKRAITNTSL